MAANGMDALTQLVESYVSSKANPFTDALALSGIRAVRSGFFAAWRGAGAGADAGRAAMAYAALLSGVTLAQVGLGSVHGLASPLGAYFPIPHGVVCGTLLAAATEMNIRVLGARAPESTALSKYAELGELLSGKSIPDREAAREFLIATLEEWTQRLALPRLREYGVQPADFDKIVAGSRGNSMKTNPIVLEEHEIRSIVERRW